MKRGTRAGRQDWVVGYRYAWQILDSYPWSTITVLDTAGYKLPFTQGRLFDTLISE